MLNTATYDKNRDICEVDQLGYVDVVKAFADGVIEGATSLDEGKFNNIKDTDAVLGKPSDIFDMLQMQRTIQDYKPSTKSNPSAETSAES